MTPWALLNDCQTRAYNPCPSVWIKTEFLNLRCIDIWGRVIPRRGGAFLGAVGG